MIIHETPGTLDIKALTLMGVSVKPNSTHPIGMFGTGLKYAIAVILRHGLTLAILTKNYRYTFSTEVSDFRGEEITMIGLHAQALNDTDPSWSNQLPFSLHYGRNWKLWMAYRELHSNTMDEDGVTYSREPETDPLTWVPDSEVTQIIVIGQEYEEIDENRRDIFLIPEDLEEVQVYDCNSFTMYRRPSRFIYYRGIKVLELQEEALFTYNIKSQQQLTEDRTLASLFSWMYEFVNVVARDFDDEELIEEILLAPKSSWEYSRIEWEYVNSPSDLFLRILRANPGRLNPDAYSMYAARERSANVIERSDLLGLYPMPWRYDSDDEALIASNDRQVMSRPDEMSLAVWDQFALLLSELTDDGSCWGKIKDQVKSLRDWGIEPDRPAICELGSEQAFGLRDEMPLGTETDELYKLAAAIVIAIEGE